MSQLSFPHPSPPESSSPFLEALTGMSIFAGSRFIAEDATVLVFIVVSDDAVDRGGVDLVEVECVVLILG